jgi:lysozyme
MNISQVGMNLIKSFEGCQLHSYQDVGGVWTIGFGHTAGVRANDTINQQQADSLLLSDVESFGHAVSDLVKVPINQYQFDSLVSFCYNVGIHALATSTLLQKLNRGDYSGAANEFSQWVHAGGKVVQGLVTRRKAEQALFNKAVEIPANVSSIIKKIRALTPTDIRKSPSHDGVFVRNCAIGEEFNVYRELGDWKCVGGDSVQGEFWVDAWKGDNFIEMTSPTTQNYTIRSGETLSVIAKRMNTSVGVIVALNPQIKNPNVIQAGQNINVPI